MQKLVKIISNTNFKLYAVILVPVVARAQNSRLGPGAVLVLAVLSIAVSLGSCNKSTNRCQVHSLVKTCAESARSITVRKEMRRDEKETRKFKLISDLNLPRE